MKRQIIFYLINIIIFPILVWVIIPFAQNLFHYNTGSDAAGAAMSKAFDYLYLCAFWCIIMLIVSAIASHFLFHKFWAGIICSAVGISLLWALPEGLDLYKFHHIKYIEHAFYYQIDGEYHKEVYESGRYKNEGRMPVGEIIFYDNGIKTHSATYKKGLMNGLYCKYYDNGVMSERGLKISKAVLSGNESDKHDEYCQGEWTFYHRNGDLDDTRIFDHGKILSSDNYNYIYHKEGTKTERFIIDIKTGKKVTTDLVLEGIIDDYTIPFHYTCSIVNGKMQDRKSVV